MSFVACQEVEAPLAEENVLSAVIEQDETTKTEMDENNNILWSANDQIIAFMKSSYGHKYNLIPSYVGKAYADFEPASSGNGGNLSAGSEWDHNVVYYPYSSSVECLKSGSNYTLDVVLPSEQTYASESFGNGSMAMVAVSEDNDITFRNVLGGMKLQLRGTQKVKSIKLEGKNNEKLSGAATVTAYTDETKPAITMASGASASVTLNCGSGIQLNESKATEFIIALPPVLFSKGFTVTVTDADSKTYTVETDKANTVLRSSILNMPAFKLGETPDSETPENAVDMILFDLDKLTVVPGTTYELAVDFEPTDAADKTLVWNSSNPSVASIDASGVVKAVADGTSTITAVAVGGATASCTVTVKSCVVSSVDYIADGVNYGKGIAIGDVIWAPVNCGYEAPTDTYKGYPYGKLYQWGRKYGQGYDTDDASYPSFIQGPITLSAGQSEENIDNVYYVTESPKDWCINPMDNLWNSGTEDNPVKTKYDPCPKGWRVPTYAELKKLNFNYSPKIKAGVQEGRYFSGEYTYTDSAPQVFLSAAGYNTFARITGYVRNSGGFYWSSGTYRDDSFGLGYFVATSPSMRMDDRQYGYSVRCVQE